MSGRGDGFSRLIRFSKSIRMRQWVAWLCLAFAALFIISLALAVLFGTRGADRSTVGRTAPEIAPLAEEPPAQEPPAQEPLDGVSPPVLDAAPNYSLEGLKGTSSEPARNHQSLLAVVIDDWGYEWEAAGDFLALGVPLNIAVLPYLPLSEAQAQEAAAHGHQILLHLPMEPLDPAWELGEGAVTTVMTTEDIAPDVEAAMAAVPHVSGVNNHMGSKATADRRVVRAVLEAVKRDGTLFLDSRTTSESVIEEVARELDVPYLRNDQFIDPDGDSERIRERILRAAELAQSRGWAIVIGHVRSETYTGLVTALGELDRQGVRLVYLRDIVVRLDQVGTGQGEDEGEGENEGEGGAHPASDTPMGE